MTIWYVNCDSGNDAADGLSWGTAVRHLSAVPTGSVAPGDEVRIAKSPDPVVLGSASWTANSATVTFSSAPVGLTIADLISPATGTYWDPEPWYAIASISGSTVTLSSSYRGTTRTITTSKRVTAKPGLTGVAVQWGGGQAFTNGTAAQRIKISGGWNTGSGLCDGQTFLDAEANAVILVRVLGHYTDLSRVSTVRQGFLSLTQLVGNYCNWEIDNALNGTSGPNVVVGSGVYTGSIAKINAIVKSYGDGIHIHTSYNTNVTLGKLLDSGQVGVSQNNDWRSITDTVSNTYVSASEIAWNTFGGVKNFNFVGGCTFEIGSLHDNGTVGIRPDATWTTDPNSNPVAFTESATFKIGDAVNNTIDIDFLPGGSPVSGTEYVLSSTLRSATKVNYNPTYTTVIYGLPSVVQAVSAPVSFVASAPNTSVGLTFQASSAQLVIGGNSPTVVAGLTFQVPSASLALTTPVVGVTALAGTTNIRLSDGTVLSVKYFDGSQWVPTQIKTYPFN